MTRFTPAPSLSMIYRPQYCDKSVLGDPFTDQKMVSTFLHNEFREDPCSGRTGPFFCLHMGIGSKGMGEGFIQACQCGRCYISEFFCLFLTELALPVVKTFQGNAVLPAPFLFAQRTAVGFQDDLIPLAGTDLK